MSGQSGADVVSLEKRVIDKTDINLFVQVLENEVRSYRVPVVDLIAVQTKDPYRVLVATILSARTRDEVTAVAADRLFAQAPDLAALSRIQESDLARLIRPVGFFRAKAGYLSRLAAAVDDRFGGRIPETVEELVQLPGVGRKTANLVVSVAFLKPAICVDTHVHRIMNIWGYVATKTPLATEMALRQTLPERHWRKINSLLVAFGQGTCRPVAPHCDRCVLADRCPRIGVVPRRLKNMPKENMKTVNGAGKEARRFISWNVNGLRAVAGKGFVDLVTDFDAEIIALQEIKAMPEQLPDEVRELPGYHAYWHSAEKKGYSGVATYSRRAPLQVLYGIGVEEYDREGRVLTLEFDDFFFVNGYFPNAQHGLLRLDYKIAFNQALLAFVANLAQQKSVVICGDFNVAHTEIDLTNPKANVKNPGFTPPERAWMDDFLAAGFIDTFRKFNPDPGHYTWWSYRFNARAKDIGWRIDYFCVDKKSEARVLEAGILKTVMGSDHCPVSLIFR